MLVLVVDGLSHPEEILGKVEDLGRRHVDYGVHRQHYTTVGEALLWTLRTGLGEAVILSIAKLLGARYFGRSVLVSASPLTALLSCGGLIAAVRGTAGVAGFCPPGFSSTSKAIYSLVVSRHARGIA